MVVQEIDSRPFAHDRGAIIGRAAIPDFAT
jgi:hypothetical protein